MLDELVALEQAHVALRVSDVGGEQHAGDYPGHYDERAMAGAQPDAKLYVIPGSHPAMAARRMLELKGIPTSASTSCR